MAPEGNPPPPSIPDSKYFKDGTLRRREDALPTVFTKLKDYLLNVEHKVNHSRLGKWLGFNEPMYPPGMDPNEKKRANYSVITKKKPEEVADIDNIPEEYPGQRKEAIPSHPSASAQKEEGEALDSSGATILQFPTTSDRPPRTPRPHRPKRGPNPHRPNPAA